MKNFNVQIKEKKNLTEILLSGNLTISNAESIHKKILIALETSKKIMIGIDNVESIDLTMIQLLYGVQRTISRRGIELTATVNLPQDLSMLMEKNGFKNILINT